MYSELDCMLDKSHYYIIQAHIQHQHTKYTKTQKSRISIFYSPIVPDAFSILFMTIQHSTRVTKLWIRKLRKLGYKQTFPNFFFFKATKNRLNIAHKYTVPLKYVIRTCSINNYCPASSKEDKAQNFTNFWKPNQKLIQSVEFYSLKH